MNKLIFALFIALLITGCKNRSTIYFYSLDKSQCVTVISEYDYRYVIDGKQDQLPDTNYIKLLVKYRNTLHDEFFVCWKNDKYEWDVVVINSEVIESKLDTSRFNFNTELPKDEREIPTALKFSKENCVEYDFELNRLFPNKGAIVEYK